MKGIILFFGMVAALIITGCKSSPESGTEPVKVSYLLGEATIGGAPAKLNQVLTTGQIIETGAQSLIEIKIGEQGGFQVRENGRVELLWDEQGWSPRVTRGAVLTLLRPGTSYHLNGTAAVIAVRGTIFYVNCYDDSTQYTCTCNGTVELSEQDSFLRKVTASHHEPYLIRETGAGPEMEPAPMKEHDDVQIFEFMYRLERND